MNNLKTTNIADLKVGDIFQTHSGAEFKVLNEFYTVYNSKNKKVHENICLCLTTNKKFSLLNFKDTIILK